MARPRRPHPPPLRTNDVHVAAVGTAGWAIALVVLLLIRLPEPDRWWLWVCVTGITIGLFGIWYIPRLQRSRAALTTGRTAKRYEIHNRHDRRALQAHDGAQGHPTEDTAPERG